MKNTHISEHNRKTKYVFNWWLPTMKVDASPQKSGKPDSGN